MDTLIKLRSIAEFSDLKDYYWFDTIDSNVYREYNKGNYRKLTWNTDKDLYKKMGLYTVDGKRVGVLKHRLIFSFNYGKIPKGMTIDHIKPISKGGTDDIENLQVLSTQENVKKMFKDNGTRLELTREKVYEICEMKAYGYTSKEITIRLFGDVSYLGRVNKLINNEEHRYREYKDIIKAYIKDGNITKGVTTRQRENVIGLLKSKLFNYEEIGRMNNLSESTVHTIRREIGLKKNG